MAKDNDRPAPSRLKVLDSRGREVDAWRMCFRKCRYPTRARAKRAARKHGLHVYRCPLCRQWHLTSRRGRRTPKGRGKAPGGDGAADAQQRAGDNRP